ncbi:serine protease do : PDZ/DHR/GLGF domain protein OS=Pirellula staleyi (strain ATCC 27377 / DSM 6068 / ICPB 4128) GN=Psta_3927 PE=4 SV=1: Trypsin_2: PDZ_2 [Gemmata massiliana]|uniref:PDZ domain-containing protein n=1 Tax=Gemmata massiliana TaxID=1210884 RepID=A0A6P2D6R9_9BACT|nr:trypsin-like peptidase domain-containing protein [Gemmata massiliana]VTR96703.1 serine protease do : PDZ/DHR/GLGF domain protein OS=Pirellula staleyi (strain ATCC 27377 / DSM 6068 / ICPB 4128) GN=Psta_3927 PE=4 SV=1: Trypsin_2: PDZ_2 [Gemmata massiliana]
MKAPRSARWAVCFGLLIAAAFAASSTAADPEAKWDPARTTQPEDLAELKSLQTTVKKVVDKCSPATVAVLYGASAGSGVIVSEDGLVLTAAHVIRDYELPKKGSLEGRALPFTAGKEVTIRLPDGDTVEGKTLGINEGIDSGMVQITGKKSKKGTWPKDGKWPFLPVAKSGALQKGTWVVSLGPPNGPRDGRPPVARLGRIQGSTKSILRTDCTLVGGDSGGPLFDLNGNVIGIHSRIGLPISQNIHVQADQFKNDWDKLVAGEWIDQPKPTKSGGGAYIGVVFPDDDEEDAWLKEVEEEGPAGRGGLKVGDTITKFNNDVVKSVKVFRKQMESAKPGDQVRITVRRGATILTLPVTLTKRA